MITYIKYAVIYKRLFNNMYVNSSGYIKHIYPFDTDTSINITVNIIFSAWKNYRRIFPKFSTVEKIG